MALLPQVAVMNPVVFNHHGPKDSRWLMLDVCREYTRNKCSRSEDECRFAHPTSNVEVQNGKVICCFDSIKGKCQRLDPPCKYLHPPQHLKEQLLQNGRRNLILRHIQTQFFMNGIQRVLPVHQFPAQNAARFGTYYSPTYTSFPSLVPQNCAGPDGGVCGGQANGDLTAENCQQQLDAVNGGGSPGINDGENIAPIISSNSCSQVHHQMDVWSAGAGGGGGGGAATPPSSVVAVDSNGYVTSYCSPVYSPVYYQRACAIPGMVPMVKTDSVADTKYEVPMYQAPPPPPGLTYPPMVISSSMPYQSPYFPYMIPGPVTSAMPRY
jgi:hypothetical protein